MERWMNCPGSVKLSEGMPSQSSAYAEEGTMAHDIAAAILCGEVHKDAPQEMLDAVQVHVDFVMALSNQDPDSFLTVEERLDLSHLHPGLFGTADAIIYQPNLKTLHVVDYKHGQGIPVDVIDDGKPNVQLMYYGLGALEQTKAPCEFVSLHIVQPRCHHPDGPIRSVKFQAVDMIDFAADLVDYAILTESPSAPLKAGDWCRFCPAAVKCPVVRDRALAISKQEFTPTQVYDPAKLSETLQWLDVVEAFIKNVRAFAYAEAERGRTPPGFKLVEKRANRKWVDESKVGELAKELGADIFDHSLKTVAQAEKVLGKETFKEKFSEFVVQESSGLTLVPDTDKRPAAQPRSIEGTFPSLLP